MQIGGAIYASILQVAVLLLFIDAIKLRNVFLINLPEEKNLLLINICSTVIVEKYN